MKQQPSGEPPGSDSTPAVAALAKRHDLAASEAVQLGLLHGLVTRDPFAPTSVREPLQALNDHLADALVALEIKRVRKARQIADLGAGAGLPGLPLAIALPAAEVVLVESNGRKCEFIKRAIVVCRIVNATVVNARAEAWPEGLDRFDLVTARAVAPLAVMAEYAAPLLQVGGALVIWRGRRDPADEAAGARAALELGLEQREPLRVAPYPGAANRHLQVIVKIQPTPVGFPRRPGVARKRPLGGGD